MAEEKEVEEKQEAGSEKGTEEFSEEGAKEGGEPQEALPGETSELKGPDGNQKEKHSYTKEGRPRRVKRAFEPRPVNIPPEELKDYVYSVLFASAKAMSDEELVQICGHDKKKVGKALEELQAEFGGMKGPVMLVSEGNTWKLTVREKYLPVIQNLVTETELPGSVMETLAVIAYKYPILQSDLIKIRTNKAYDHLRELEEAGYIAREVFGRTRRIKLTPKFFDYFDLPPDKVKEVFKGFEAIEDVIRKKEEEAVEIKKMVKEKQAKDVEAHEKQKEEIGKLGNLEVFEEPEEKPSDEDAEEEGQTEKLGDLEVFEEPEAEDAGEGTPREFEEAGEVEEVAEKEGTGVELSEEAEAEVDKRVEELLHPPPEVEQTEGVGAGLAEEGGEEENPEGAPEEGEEETSEPSEDAEKASTSDEAETEEKPSKEVSEPEGSDDAQKAPPSDTSE